MQYENRTHALRAAGGEGDICGYWQSVNVYLVEKGAAVIALSRDGKGGKGNGDKGYGGGARGGAGSGKGTGTSEEPRR